MPSHPSQRSGVRGLGDGAIELDVVLAVLDDVRVEVDAAGVHRASFVLEGHLPATQLGEDGVSLVVLEALHLTDLAVTGAVGDRLACWAAAAATVTGHIHFERRAVDRYRGRGPLRTLALVDEHGVEIVLQHS